MLLFIISRPSYHMLPSWPAQQTLPWSWDVEYCTTKCFRGRPRPESAFHRETTRCWCRARPCHSTSIESITCSPHSHPRLDDLTNPAWSTQHTIVESRDARTNSRDRNNIFSIIELYDVTNPQLKYDCNIIINHHCASETTKLGASKVLLSPEWGVAEHFI